MTSKHELGKFFSGLSATHLAARKANELFEPMLAFRFNPLNFFSPKENKLSEILAFFLNPKEAHGQGATFLNIFLDKLGIADRAGIYNTVSVQIELPTDENRRIDIVLRLDDGRFVLAIENKLWAGDQQKQLADYNAYLQKSGKDYLLLYLTPWGHAPKDHSISEADFKALEKAGKLMTTAYDPTIIDIVADWQKNSRSERVRSFLKDFEQYLKQEINNESFMAEHKIVTDYILAENQVELALTVAAAADDLKRELLKTLRVQLARIAKEEMNIGFEWNVDATKAYTGFSFSHPDLIKYNLHIQFQFQEKRFLQMCYGLPRKDNSRPIGMEFQEKHYTTRIGEELGGEVPNENWVFRKFSPDISNWEKEQYTLMADGRFAKSISEKVVELLNVLHRIGAVGEVKPATKLSHLL